MSSNQPITVDPSMFPPISILGRRALSLEVKRETELEKWGLNTVTFVWAKYGYPNHSLWLIYGNYSMKMPEINFVDTTMDSMEQLELPGNNPNHDVNIVSVAEIVKKMGENASTTVSYMNKSYVIPGGLFQRVLRLQAEFAVTNEKSAVQNADIINKYRAEVINVGDNGKVNRVGNDAHVVIAGRDYMNINVQIILVCAIAAVAAAAATTTIEVPIKEVNGVKVAETSVLGALCQLPIAFYKMWRGK